ncbi:MAG: DUF4382 domain-containing protein [Dehalococcoidales bacterium]|nr:DUF4382 domain-containing protein [Dehalococcoidales bacterium]
MNKRFWLGLFSLITIVALTLTGVGCASGNMGTSTTTATTSAASLTGTLTFNVTDAPPSQEVTSIMITISKLEVHKAVAEQVQTVTQTSTETTTQTTVETTTGTTSDTKEVEDGEWIVIDIPDTARTFDLLKVKGLEQLLASQPVATGKYTQVRLTVEKAEVALNGGELEEATVPSGVLKLVHPFDVVEGETTTVLLDFDAEKSVTVTGNNRIQVKPVIKLTVETSSKPADTSENGSRKLAEDFIETCPTFAFDGVKNSVQLKGTEAGQNSDTWILTYEFQCSHAGYGDRTGQVLAQVMTIHQARITVENGSVVEAIIDGTWNEITQETVTSS